MKKPNHRIGGAFLVASVILAVSACHDDSPPVSNSPTTSSISPTTLTPPTQSTVTPNPRTLAVTQAEELVTDYNAARDRDFANPTQMKIGQLDRWLMNPNLASQTRYRKTYKREGLHTNGVPAKLFKLHPTSVRLPTPTNRLAVVNISLCYDVTDQVTYDRDGKDVTTGWQVNVGRASYKVVNQSYPSSNGWRIAVENVPGKPCNRG